MNKYQSEFISVSYGEYTTICFLEPDLNEATTADSIANELKNVNLDNSKGVLIDFSGVGKWSGHMMYVLADLKKKCGLAGLRLVFYNMPSNIRHVFITCRLDGTVYTISDTEQLALAEFKG